ncbi:unnamed protein product [Gadus morhua 'NCC']
MGPYEGTGKSEVRRSEGHSSLWSRALAASSEQKPDPSTTGESLNISASSIEVGETYQSYQPESTLTPTSALSSEDEGVKDWREKKIIVNGSSLMRSISATERLSICLRYLATWDSYRTIANSFRVGTSTVSSIVPDVATAAIRDRLVEEFMAVPTTDEWSALRGNIPAGEVDPLPGLGRVAANNSVREAIRIREAFTSYFSAGGTVPWEDWLATSLRD